MKNFCFTILLLCSFSYASINWIGTAFGGDGFSWADSYNWSTTNLPTSSDIVEIRGDFASACPVVQSATIANPFGIWCGYGTANGTPTVSVDWNGKLVLELINNI